MPEQPPPSRHATHRPGSLSSVRTGGETGWSKLNLLRAGSRLEVGVDGWLDDTRPAERCCCRSRSPRTARSRPGRRAWLRIASSRVVGNEHPTEKPVELFVVNYGLDLLHDHQHGKDVAEVLALVDETGRREGEELEEVLQKLSAAVKLRQGS